MTKRNSTRTKMIKLLEVLRKHSDETRYLTTGELIRLLAAEGIHCDRRTLAADIQVLNDCGYEVMSEKAVGMPTCYWIADRSFNAAELRILIDAVRASKFITPERTEKLVYKLAEQGGPFRAKLLENNTVQFNTAKCSNKNIFYIVNEINNAIESKNKISFRYFDYDINHNRVYRKNGEKYLVNPVATIYDNDNYYLVCYNTKYDGVAHYRVDRMENATMELVPMDGYKGKSVDIKRHKKTIFGMFQGEEETVEFVADRSLIDVIFDVFGDDIELENYEENGENGENDDGTQNANCQKVKFNADVQLSPAFLGWCMSFGEKLKVVSPQSVVEKVKEQIAITLKQYQAE